MTRLNDLLNCIKDDLNMEDLIDTKITLNLEIDKDAILWEQWARVNWLRLSDKNTAFFHKNATQRKKSNLIQGLQKADGSLATEGDAMESIARSYFHDLSRSSNAQATEYLLNGGRRSIFYEDNDMLNAQFSAEYINKALKGMRPTKSPGDDGFPALFYQRCWHIVGGKIA